MISLYILSDGSAHHFFAVDCNCFISNTHLIETRHCGSTDVLFFGNNEGRLSLDGTQKDKRIEIHLVNASGDASPLYGYDCLFLFFKHVTNK